MPRFLVRLAVVLEIIIILFVIIVPLGKYVQFPGSNRADMVDAITLDTKGDNQLIISTHQSEYRSALRTLLRGSIVPASLIFIAFVVYIWYSRANGGDSFEHIRRRRELDAAGLRRDRGEGEVVPFYYIDPDNP